MSFDFSALLVLLTFLTGVICLIDKLIFASRRKNKSDATEPIVVEYAKSFFPIFFIVLILRSFIVEPFRIPSASMMPTLLIGDFILVNKYEYGLRLPILNRKVLGNKIPERGDIIVFRYPKDPNIPYIKRVIGIPGDKISYYDKTLSINDIPIIQTTNGRYNAYGSGIIMDGSQLQVENLYDIKHQILLDPKRYSQELEVIVPEGHYFVLGDNRDNSTDSRFWGFVPDQNLIGKAFAIWMNWDRKNDGIDFSRIGVILK